MMLTKLPQRAFWHKYQIRNIGQVRHHEDLQEHWATLQLKYNINQSPEALWATISDGKTEFNNFVHETSFPHNTYEQLISTVAPTLFVAPNTLCWGQLWRSAAHTCNGGSLSRTQSC
mmetsp:Transcript_24176/g.52810  ORF Transcript_24176/g.52810 Transcript_24176/m.52810 type:complete len:117 (+) Transcript_24176:501-851(+)